MPFFLVIIPEHDYEMLHDGSASQAALQSRIYEADSSDEAIMARLSDDGEAAAFAIEVTTNKFSRLSPAFMREKARKAQEVKEAKEREKDMLEYEKLRKKLGLP